jgi:hypothetical protein
MDVREAARVVTLNCPGHRKGERTSGDARAADSGPGTSAELSDLEITSGITDV